MGWSCLQIQWRRVREDKRAKFNGRLVEITLGIEEDPNKHEHKRQGMTEECYGSIKGLDGT